jgi:uncharacterized RDD family membrane protein YckC
MPYECKPNLKKRIFATLLDYLIFGLLWYLYMGFFGTVEEEGTLVVRNLMMVPLIVLWIVYFIVVEGIGGATLGHQAFHLKVLTIRRDKIGFTEASIRHLLDLIDIWCYGIPALIAIKYTEKHQRLGDLVAKTIVIDTEDETQYKERTEMKIFERGDS